MSSTAILLVGTVTQVMCAYLGYQMMFYQQEKKQRDGVRIVTVGRKENDVTGRWKLCPRDKQLCAAMNVIPEHKNKYCVYMFFLN